MNTRIFILSVFVSFSTASATIINVPIDYPTIQFGINGSSNGDTVLVQPGTYVENINFNGHNIVLGSLFLTTGDTSYISQTIIDGDSAGTVVTFESGEDSTAVITGFTIRNGWISGSYGGGIACTNQSNPQIIGNIISGNYADSYGGGISCYESSPTIGENRIFDNNSNVRGGGIYCAFSQPTIFGNTISANHSGSSGGGIYCLNANAMISNNKITGNSSNTAGGGGIRCDQSDAAIKYNEINNNQTSGNGGGIYCSNSNSEIDNNTINGNTASTGGGICCWGANPVISNNTINGNSTTSGGGGIICNGHTAAVFFNNTISENHADTQGGGIYCSSFSDIKIFNNIITDNIAQNRYGGGIYFYNSNPTIINNCISSNYSGMYGGGIYADYNSALYIINSIFWGNAAGIMGNEIFLNDQTSPLITYSNIQDSLWSGAGNMSVNPLFRDPSGGDYHLMSTSCGDSFDSPCIDSGSPHYSDSLLDCFWGLGSVASDMGAYGGGDTIIVSPNVFNVPIDYPTIQLAIDASSNGDTIIVLPGTYYENINFNGHNVVVGSMFMMTSDYSYIPSTIIDGSDTASVVTFDSGEDNTAYLVGFTIRNGRANHGGGIFCNGSDPVISYNIITGNSALTFGGGIIFIGSASIFNNNLVMSNSANQGGGICCMGSSPDVINDVLTRNTGNSSGGAIYCTLESNPAIINSILWADRAPESIELDCDDSSSPVVSYCDIEGGWPGEGNIDCCPEFCSPGIDDFHLTSGSCCLGAGSGGVDIGALGVGCDSLNPNCSYVTGDVNGSQSYNGLDITYGVSYLKGGPAPVFECECKSCNIWYASGDVNGSCSYNGLDITYGVSYLKGIYTELTPCLDCPPVR